MPAPTASEVSVVVCAHTMRRIDETVACVRGVRGVLGDEEPPGEVTVVIDHEPELQREITARLDAASACWPTRAPRACRMRAPSPTRTSSSPAAAPRRSGPARRPPGFPLSFSGDPLLLPWETDDGPVRNVVGCNMAFRRETFATAGGFDPRGQRARWAAGARQRAEQQLVLAGGPGADPC